MEYLVKAIRNGKTALQRAADTFDLRR